MVETSAAGRLALAEGPIGRRMGYNDRPRASSIAKPLGVLADLRREKLGAVAS